MTFSKLNSNVGKLYKDTQILNIHRIVKLRIGKLMYKINFRLVPKHLSIERSPFPAKNQILRSYRIYISPWR